MCGIIGLVNFSQEDWRQSHALLRALFLASESRGRDATGYVAQLHRMDEPFVGRTIVAKAPITASRFVEDNSVFRRLRHQRCSVFVGHVRAATHGAADTGDNRNNHSFVGEDGLYLVHNGVVLNHREVADAHALHLESECDSEVLLRLIETEEHRALGLDLCLREVQGSMAIAVFDSAAGLVWLARNKGRPLWLARLERDRRWFFASTGTVILEAFRKVLGKAESRFDYFAPIPEDTPLAIAPHGVVLAPLSGPS
ncbi:MAG: class II glutamine amidotransferase [Bacillota bacterium]